MAFWSPRLRGRLWNVGLAIDRPFFDPYEVANQTKEPSVPGAQGGLSSLPENGEAGREVTSGAGERIPALPREEFGELHALMTDALFGHERAGMPIAGFHESAGSLNAALDLADGGFQSVRGLRSGEPMHLPQQERGGLTRRKVPEGAGETDGQMLAGDRRSLRTSPQAD
jgi:hypothetical protein